MKKVILMFLILLVCACTDKAAIDNFIETHDRMDFSEFDNLSISQIDDSFSNTSTYIINRKSFKFYYLIEFKYGEILKLEKVGKTKYDQDYLSIAQITNLLNKMEENDFKYVCYDGNNLLINPFVKRAPAYFLRLSVPTSDSIINGYIHYKKNWYIDEDHIDDIK